MEKGNKDLSLNFVSPVCEDVVCHVCGDGVNPFTGYILKPETMLVVPEYWTSLYSDILFGEGSAEEIGLSDVLFVFFMSANYGYGQLVCDECSEMFSFNTTIAKELAYSFWKTGKRERVMPLVDFAVNKGGYKLYRVQLPIMGQVLKASFSGLWTIDEDLAIDSLMGIAFNSFLTV